MSVLMWPGTGEFAYPVVGLSHYDGRLSVLAANPIGDSAHVMYVARSFRKRIIRTMRMRLLYWCGVRKSATYLLTSRRYIGQRWIDMAWACRLLIVDVQSQGD